MTKKKLSAEHNQLDLFFADFIDPNLRDERGTMEHPFFSLEKTPRTTPIIYEKGDIKIEVNGTAKYGIASIWDADFLIWAASQLNEAIEKGETPSRRLWVIPYQYLVQTKRIDPTHKGSRAYDRFLESLTRLQSTSIRTTLKADKKEIKSMWSWIDAWEVHKDEKGHLTGIEVVLSDWLFSRIAKDRAVLSIHEDYFLLTGGLSRWLYRIARKHCGNNERWFLSIETLHEKSGVTRDLRHFKSDLKKLIAEDCLPEYHTTWREYGDKEGVEFYPRAGALTFRKMPRAIKKIFIESKKK